MAPELNQMSFRKIKELILEIVNMVDNTIFISVKDIMKTLSISKSKAYSVVRELNKELTEQGYMVIPGKEKSASLDMIFEDFWKRYEADVKPQVRENTWKSKEYVVYLKILPYFKDLIMRDITPRDIVQWQNQMRESTGRCVYVWQNASYMGNYNCGVLLCICIGVSCWKPYVF